MDLQSFLAFSDRVAARTGPRTSGAQRAILLLASVSALGLGVRQAQAQGQASAAVVGATLEQVVVTAQKREDNIQRTPVTVTAISAKLLDQAHVVDAVDLNGFVPSLVISTSEGFNRSVAIRGIGFNVPQNDAAQPSVSYHIDGIYIANPVALDTGFLDVNHIEVIRGPQGTVYGQNSTGGTINVISNLPTLSHYGGDADLSLGNFDLVRFRSDVNMPLRPDLALRLSVDQDYHSGFAQATQVPGTGGRYDLSNDNSLHGRAQLLWKPTNDFSVLLRAEYAQAHNNETEGKNIFDPNPNPWRQTSDWPGKFIYSNQLYSGTLSYAFGWANLKFLTSYQTVSQTGSVNEDGLDLALSTPNHDVEYLFHKSRAHTEEIDLSSPTGGRLDWIVGAFYLKVNEKVGYDQYLLSTTDTFDPDLLYSPPLDYVPSNLYFQSASALARESYSVYGQGTFHLTPVLRVTGGIRETHDHNTTDISDYFNLFGPPVYVRSSVYALTGKAGVEYDITPANMAYISYSTGFKPGGGNISLAPEVVPYQFKPEHNAAYEVGLKNSFFGNRGRLNLAGFYYDYTNLQYEAEDAIPFEGGVDNIPSMRVYGIEGEGSALLPYNLRLDASLTVENGQITSHFLALDNARADQVDATYGLFSDADLAGRLAAYTDVRGNPPPNLPRMTAAMTLTHSLSFGDGSALTSSVNVQYRDQYINTVFGNEVINGVHIYRAPSYVLANLFFGYAPARSPWSASFTLKNLFDYGAVLGRFTNQFGGETTQQYAAPRQFIFDVAYRF